MDLKRGFIGRRVCGGIEIGAGVLFLLGSFSNTADIATLVVGIAFASFIIVTGILGTVSNSKGLVIAYMVNGIIVAVLLALLIVGEVIIVIGLSSSDVRELTDNSTYTTVVGIFIAALVLLVLFFTVAVLGVIFACLPFCARHEDRCEVGQYHQFDTTAAGTLPPPYIYVNTATTKQGPV